MKKKTFGAIENFKKFHNRCFHKIEIPVCPQRFFIVTNTLRFGKKTKKKINQDGHSTEAHKALTGFYLFSLSAFQWFPYN